MKEEVIDFKRQEFRVSKITSSLPYCLLLKYPTFSTLSQLSLILPFSSSWSGLACVQGGRPESSVWVLAEVDDSSTSASFYASAVIPSSCVFSQSSTHPSRWLFLVGLHIKWVPFVQLQGLYNQDQAIWGGAEQIGRDRRRVLKLPLSHSRKYLFDPTVAGPSLCYQRCVHVPPSLPPFTCLSLHCCHLLAQGHWEDGCNLCRNISLSSPYLSANPTTPSLALKVLSLPYVQKLNTHASSFLSQPCPTGKTLI